MTSFKQGESLAEYVIKNRAIKEDLALLRDWSIQLISALIYLSGKGVIVRNLSLDNVILNDSKISLLNFGIFYVTESGMDVEFIVGASDFMPPEMEATTKVSRGFFKIRVIYGCWEY